MKILLTNPRLFVMGGENIFIGGEVNEVQLIRQIEKQLLKKSIICDKIEVMKE